jgi:hypothetical protein
MLLNYQIIASCEEFQAKAFALELSELGWVLDIVVLSWPHGSHLCLSLSPGWGW